jgi:hypothetical protein
MPEDKKEERKRIVVEEVNEEIPVVSDAPLEEIKQASQEVQEKAQEIETLADEVSAPSEPQKMPSNEYIPPKQEVPQSPLLIIIPGLFLLGALLGGIVFYQNSLSKKGEATPAPTAVSSETPAASSSPSASVDLEKYEIAIQNGSGIAGEAGKAKDALTKAGFTVSSTGNASEYSYTSSIIQAKSDVDSAFLTKLSETLGETYKVGKSQTLPDSSKDDVVVIVGSSKAE